MANKKFELKNFNNYFTWTIILFVIFLIYICDVIYFHNDSIAKTNIQFIVDLWFTQKEYESIGDLLVSWGWSVVISYIFGFLIAGLGWNTERKKRKQAEGQANGLKGKLSKVENERDFYKKKYEILEKGINSSATAEDKKPNNKGKPKNKKTSVTSIIVFVVIVVVGGMVIFKTRHSDNHQQVNEPSEQQTNNTPQKPKTPQIPETQQGQEVPQYAYVHIGIPKKSNNANTQK